MNVTDLIGHGQDATTSRHDLLDRCIHFGLIEADTYDPNRQLMKLLHNARKECVIISTGNGYYIPTVQEINEVQAYIRKEEHRASMVNSNLLYARKYLEDMKKGRLNG